MRLLADEELGPASAGIECDQGVPGAVAVEPTLEDAYLLTNVEAG